MNIRRKALAIILALTLAITGSSAFIPGAVVNADTGTTHDAVAEWLSELNRLNSNMQNKGFTYGACKYTYEEALSSNKRVNCGGYVGWALIHMGLFDSKKSFYYKNYFENHSDIYQIINVNKTPQELKNVLKPGDIIRYEVGGHHHVFAGWKDDGVTPLWYATGRGMMWTRKSPVAYYSKLKIKSIIRIRRYNVKVTATNGTINGGGTYFASKDAVINYTPKSGYVIKSVKIDGNACDVKKYGNSVTFDDISENHTVDVVYAKKSSTSATTTSASSATLIPGRTTDYLNYRSGPGIIFDTVGTIGKKKSVYIKDYVMGDDGRMWYNIKIDDGNYYVCANWVTPESTVPQGKYVAPKTTTKTTASETTAAASEPKTTTATASTSAAKATTTTKTTTTTAKASTSTTTKTSSKTITGTTTDAVNYRSGPGTSFGIVGTLSKNKTVTVVDQVKGDDGKMWYHVKINKKDYYMCSTWVKVSGTVPTGKSIVTAKTTTNKTSSTTAPKTITGTTTDAVNYRSGPGTTYGKLGTLSKNKTVTVVDQVKGTDGKIWYHVKINNKDGYMCSTWVKVSGTVPAGKFVSTGTNTSRNKTTTTTTASTSTSSTSGTVTGKTTDAVNYRIGPGTLFSVAGTVAKGKSVTILCSVKDVNGDMWYKVKISDKVYYMSAKWIKPSATVKGGTANVKGVTKDALNCREKAGKSSKTLGTFTKGKQIQITGATKVNNELWYRVTYNGKTGYVSGKWVTVSVGS